MMFTQEWKLLADLAPSPHQLPPDIQAPDGSMRMIVAGVAIAVGIAILGYRLLKGKTPPQE